MENNCPICKQQFKAVEEQRDICNHHRDEINKLIRKDKIKKALVIILIIVTFVRLLTI